MSVVQSYFLYYFIVIFTSLVVSISEKVRKSNLKRLSKFIFWFAVLLPIVISANRYGPGTDFFSYEQIYFNITGFNNFINAYINTPYEPGWIILNYVVKYIFDDVKYLFVTSSILIWIFNFKAIYSYRNKINIGVATLILMSTMYNLSFNAIRQSLAASILLLTIKFIEEKNFPKFLSIVLLAASIHYTALIFLPIYWVINSKSESVNLIKRTLFVLSIIFLMALYQPMLSILTSFEIFSKYSVYKLEFSGFGIGNIIIKMPIILLIILNLKTLKIRERFIFNLSILYFAGLIFEFFGFLSEYVGRIAIYFEMIQIIILASIIKVQKNKYGKVLYTILIIFYFLILFTNNIIFHNYHNTIPYNW